MKLRLVNILVMAIATIATIAPAQPPDDAGIAGCISDGTAQQIPGATIIAKGGGVRRTTETDATGCYELKGLPPESYRITARVTGFDNVTQDRVLLATATITRLDFAMHISPICECLSVGDRSLTDRWTRAEAVLRVRVSDADPDEATRSGSYRHVATVVDDLKPSAAGRSRTGRLLVVQNQRSGAPEPYDAGQDLIVFLMSERSDMFFIVDDSVEERGADTRAMAFLVQDGRIQRAPSDFARYVGLPVDRVLDELRAIARPVR